MNRQTLRIIIVAGLAFSLGQYFWPQHHHVPPQNPKTFVMDIGVEEAGAFQISMWVPFGSTSDSVPGIAHVLEHLKFKTKADGSFSGFDAIPGSSSNAATSYTFTRYDLGVPPPGLEQALQVLAVMAKPLTITEADLKLEKTVVSQELLQRSQSNPDTPFYQDYTSQLYKGLPYENPPGGTQQTVASVTMTDVLAFDKAHYQSSPVFISIGGPPLKPDDIALIDKYFPNAALGDIQVSRKFESTRNDAELQNLPPFIPSDQIGEIPASTFAVSQKSPRARSVKLTVTKILSAPTSWRSVAAASILLDAIRSRLPEGLYDRISEDNRMVQSWTFGISRQSEGVWQISFNADVTNGVDAGLVQTTVENYFSELARNGLSQKNFDRLKARNFLLSEWENTSARASSMASDAVVFGYANSVGYMDELQKTTLSDVNDLLRALQKPGRVGVAQLVPEGGTP
jgi:predicted Zn-dependent peptidase